ncbi:TonB-dependent siderophore receptor [Pseudomonas eucalypticola]|uniref:TonB-dependent receptor n=1 Tax=Pseudomonas eucalypticola TaxID=2599595 RepID=A0A7D5H7K2_9PSED|nr:TonB-dependent receptor [Pseudomonas eucalypticola]QKZ05024.1 TonB-dependent receptor [Pseudomonas eucalypticola]
MRCRLRLSLLAAALSGPLALPPLAVADAAVAAVPRYAIALKAQPLPDALAALSRQTGQNIVYAEDLPYQVQAPAVAGQFTVEQALGRLLVGTPLGFRRTSPTTLVLATLTGSDDRIVLQPLNIDGERGPHYQPDPVSHINHSAAPWLEQPQSISRVNNAVLRDQQPRNLDDALRNVSGLTQGNTLGSTQDTLIKRGFGDNRDGSILRDGMPVVQGRNFNATADSVEVLKGPTALLYGIQDPGGVINVVTKTPQLSAHTELQSKASSFAHGRDGSAVTLDSTGPLGDRGLAYRLILDHQDEDYWRNFGVHRETLVAPSLAWYGEQSEVQLSYEHRRFVTPFDRGTAINPATGHPLDIPYTRRLDEPFNDMTGRSELARLSIKHLLDNGWTLHGAYSYNAETYDAYQVRITAVAPAKGTLTRSMDGTLGSVSRAQQGELELSGSRRWWGLEHEVLVGMSEEHRLYFRGDLLRQASLTTFSYINPVYGQEVAPTLASATASDQLDRLRTSAFYLRDTLHLNEQWIATLGARFLVYDQYAGRGRPFHANTDINGEAWVPSAGLVYRFAPNWSWYGSYSESFKPNSSIAPLNAASEQIIDASILPEQAKAWETGLKYEEPDGLSVSIALYDIRKRNVLVSETVDNLPVSRNAGAVRSRGLELEASGQMAEGWQWMAAYAYTHAWVTRDPELAGKPLQNVPRQSGSLYLTHDLGSLLGGDRLRVGGGPRYVGERAGDPSNSFRLPAYTVTDAFARYDTQLGGHDLHLQLNVNNLFDRHYYPSSVSQYFVSVGDPRQLVLSTTLGF